MKRSTKPSSCVPAGVELKRARVPDALPDTTAQGTFWQVAPRRFLLVVPAVARYLVEDGQQITVDASSSADESTVLHCSRMTPLAALLYQRGAVAFDAPSASTRHGGLLFAADLSAEKSAAAAAMRRQRWPLLGSDLSCVEVDRTGSALLGHTEPGFEPGPAVDTVSLWRIVRLTSGDGKEPRLAKMKDSARIGAMQGVLYNHRVARAIMGRELLMDRLQAIASASDFQVLRWPRGRLAVTALASCLARG